MPRFLLDASALCVLLLLAMPAAADTTIHFESTGHGASTVQLVKGLVRIDGADESHWTLYSQTDDVVYIVTPADRSYTRIDRDGIAMLGGQMDKARAEMAKQLENLPPEQRAMAEQMMKQMMGQAMGKPEPPPEPKATGNRRTVKNVVCDDFEVDQGSDEQGAPLGKELMCVASGAALGLGAGELEAVRGMYALLGQLSEATGFAGARAPRADRLPGVPILIQKAGSEERQSLTAVDHEDLPSSRFRLPEGFSERDPKQLGR